MSPLTVHEVKQLIRSHLDTRPGAFDTEHGIRQHSTLRDGPAAAMVSVALCELRSEGTVVCAVRSGEMVWCRHEHHSG